LVEILPGFGHQRVATYALFGDNTVEEVVRNAPANWKQPGLE
jgi:hypothetical protein